MREIVLDTETTGFKPEEGHRIVEIGCVELFNHVPTGEHYHVYINPERDMPQAAFEVHGLSTDFLSKHKVFKEVADGFLEFIKDSPLVIHNASFDMRFINAELVNHGYDPVPYARAIDTLAMAKKKFPGSPASLDALCRRFNVDSSARTLHGALLDSELLAAVYLELLGGKQPSFGLQQSKSSNVTNLSQKKIEKKSREKRQFSISDDELKAHEEFLEQIKDPIWKA